MKLPWDKGYLKISFHVIFTLTVIIILGAILPNLDIALLWVFDILKILVKITLPLIIAVIIACFMDTPVEFFQKHWNSATKFRTIRNVNLNYNKRTAGAAITYILLAALIFLGIWFTATKVGYSDITELAEKINENIRGLSDLLVLFKVKLAELGLLKNIDGILESWINYFTRYASSLVIGIANNITKAGGLFLNIFLGFVIAFYILAEKEKIVYYLKDVLDVFFNPKWSKRFKGFFSDINTIFSGYIGGQLADAFIMAVLISSALSILNIKYAIMIGIISGFSNLIPYIGAVVAFVLAVGVALISGSPSKALYAAVAVIALQQIDGIFIVPRIVGRSVKLHPVLVILSLSIFGKLFGIIGMVFAVPVTALIKLFACRIYERKKYN